MSRSSLLRKLCFSLGIPNEIDILTIEGLAILPLLHKQNHPKNIKLTLQFPATKQALTSFAMNLSPAC
jgi:hypothetical protein